MYKISPSHDFLIGIDSDGCAFDTMELKHKECFIPNIINFFELQGISKYAREAAEFVNLYSKSRGVNRFPALVETLQWLQKRREVKARGYDIEIPKAITEWIDRETKLGNPALEAEVERSDDETLKHLLQWSKAVNETVTGMVRGVPPFPRVKDCLEKMQGKADVLVVSATPNEALTREWEEHDIAKYVVEICGQEHGSKKETLENASQYDKDHTLMVGDAPGDYKAALANNALFFPVNPGAEEASWERFYNEGLDKFFNLEFSGAYQQTLLEEFETFLPANPPWPVDA